MLQKSVGKMLKLEGKKIAVLATDGFEYVELAGPCAALHSEGARVEIVSLHEGRIRGMNLTEPTRTVRVDKTLERAVASDYDGLFIPGGFVSPDFLRQSRVAREFVRSFDADRKPIATLCHGPWLLVSAELVGGRHLASWPGIRDDVVHAGGIWRDEAVVRDQNWISSRGPHDLPEFTAAMIQLFAEGIAGFPQLAAPWSTPSEIHSSPKPVRPSALAVGAARALPGPAIPALAGAALGIFASMLVVSRALR